MNDKHKTKAQLIAELQELRRRVAQMEEAEQSQNNRGPFRALVETAASAIFIWQDSVFRYTNPAFSKLTGYTAEELPGANVWDLVHPEYRELINERVLAWQRGEPVPPRSEFKILTKSGETRWIDADSTFIEFDGNPAALTIAYDITERKRAEEALRQSEAKFRVLAETAASIIYIYQGSRCIYVNPYSRAYTGYSEGELLSMDFWEIVHPEHRELVRERLRARLRGEAAPSHYEIKIVTKNGEERWIDFAASPMEFEGKPSLLGSAFDVTDRKRAEEALRKSQERLQHVLSFSPAIIYLLNVEDEGFTPEWVSQSLTRLTGYERGEALSEGWWVDHIHPDDRGRVLAEMPRLFTGDRLVHEYRFRHKDGGYLWLHDESRLLRDESGKPVEAIGSLVDVTDRREAEAALRDSEERFRTLVSSMDDIVFTVDRHQRHTGGFGRWMERLELEPGVFIGKTASEVLGADAGLIHEEANTRALAGEQVIYEWSMATNRETRHFQTSLSPIHNQDGDVTGLVGVGRDITERKRAEDDQRKQSEILQKIFDHIPVMIRFLGEDGRFRLVNREWERTMGWSREEIHSQNLNIFAEIYPDPKYRQTVLNFIAESSAEWADFKTRVRDGRVIDTSWANVHLSDGTSIGIGQDVTERKRADELLRRQTAQLAALHEIGLEISAESQLSRVLDVVTRRAAELLNAYHCSVYIRDGEQAELNLVASLDSGLIGLRLKEGEGLAGLVAVTGEAVAVEDYSEWHGRASMFDGKGFGPSLSAPLKWQHTVIGAISLARRQGEERFTDDEIQFMEQIAADAAIAIHQASLFGEVQEGRWRLQVLSHRLIEAQEAERKRLARELHDQIGQALTAVQISLQALRPSLDSVVSAQRLEESLAIIDDALQQVHDLSLDLRPSMLDDLGLVAALRWYVDRVAGISGLADRFKAGDLHIRLAPEVETACFRIAQEALTNVLRHAHATGVWVEVKHSNSDLRLLIRDDGVGFDVRAAMSRTGPNASLGLQGMRERAAALGGLVDIKSKQGRGTEVQASFPLKQSRSS